MNIVKIFNFGPISEATIDLDKKIQVFIGPQASGKSTICKVIYFCQKIRDYTLDFLMDAEQFKKNHPNEYFNHYMKYLKKQFIGCFGKTRHMRRFVIIYRCNDRKIKIKLDREGYVRFEFDDYLKEGTEELIKNAAEMHLEGFRSDKFSSIIDNVTALAMMKRQLQEALSQLFENGLELIYIPAGRSLLATMSEQLRDFSVSEMDLTMQEFINLIWKTKSKFGSKIPDMIKDYLKTENGQINNSSVNSAYELIKEILKADYTSDSEGEKIYFDETHWVKLMYGSSGQQEVLWILMLIFIAILEKKERFMVIEEPEAHLFPIAQKNVVNLISLLVNTTDSRVIVTTHSPYILTSWNILLYSEKVEGHQRGDNAIIAPNLRVSYNDFAAYKVENTEETEECLEILLEKESHMIRTDYIDEVSSITNVQLDKLLDKEVGE